MTKPSLDKAVTTGINARWCQAETVPLKYELRILKYWYVLLVEELVVYTHLWMARGIYRLG